MKNVVYTLAWPPSDVGGYRDEDWSSTFENKSCLYCDKQFKITDTIMVLYRYGFAMLSTAHHKECVRLID